MSMPSLKSVPVVASASEDEEEETEEKWENCLRQGKLSDAAAELDSDLKLRPVVWKSVDKIRRALSVFWHNKRFPDALKLLKNSKVSLFSSVPLLESLSVTLLGLGQASLALTCALAGLNLEKKKPSSASSSSLENLIRRLIKFHVVTDADFSQKNHPTLEDLKEFITNFSADTFSPEDNGATEAALTDLPLLAHFEAASSGSDLLLERAKTSFGRKKWRHAIQCFTKLIQVCPSSASSATRNCYAYGLARAQVQNDENAKAVEGYKELFKDQNNPFIPAYYGLAQLYLKHKNLTAALDANKEGHKLHQDLADEARDSESLSCELEPAFPELGPGAVLTFLFDNQRKEIQSHPAPDGVCRNTSCPVPATFPYRREIFADDPGAKDGFYLVHCSMRCSFHLHKNCYKSVRETTPKKDLAGSDCITPDCFGKCVQIFLLKENGFKKEIASITVPLQGPAAVAAAAAAPTPAEPAKAAAAKSSEAAAAVPAASERANVKDEGTSKKERATSPEKSKKSEMETKPTKSSEEKPSAEKHPPPSCDPTVLKISKDTSNLKVTKDVERGMEAQAAAAAASYTTTTKVSDPKSSPSKSKSAADVSAVKKLAKAPSKPPPPQQPKKRLISHEYKTLEKNEFKILGRMRQQYPAWSEFSDPEPHSTVDDVHGSGIELKMNCEKTLRKISNALVTGGRRDRDQQQAAGGAISKRGTQQQQPPPTQTEPQSEDKSARETFYMSQLLKAMNEKIKELNDTCAKHEQTIEWFKTREAERIAAAEEQSARENAAPQLPQSNPASSLTATVADDSAVLRYQVTPPKNTGNPSVHVPATEIPSVLANLTEDNQIDFLEMLLGERSEEVTPPVPPQPQNHHHHQLQQLQMQQQQLQMQQQQFPMQQHQLQMQQQHQQLPMQQHQLQMQQQHQQLPMQQQQQQLQMQQQLQQLPMQHQHQQLQMQQQYQLHQMQEQQQQQPKRPVVHQRDSRRGSAFSPTDEVAVLENLLQTRETYEDFNRGATSSCNDCVVCIEPMTESMRLMTLKPCGHMFHEDCIKKWLLLKSDCPNCRQYIVLEDEYPAL